MTMEVFSLMLLLLAACGHAAGPVGLAVSTGDDGGAADGGEVDSGAGGSDTGTAGDGGAGEDSGSSGDSGAGGDSGVTDDTASKALCLITRLYDTNADGRDDKGYRWQVDAAGLGLC